jgi:lipid-A-disaccharide synthase
MKLFLVAGEASGDSRGAELMRALAELHGGEIAFHGLGGPQMSALSGGNIRDWSDRAGVIGFIDVIKNYGYFRREFAAALAELERLQPDAVIFVDYPGFNLRLAAAIKQRRPSQRVIYYISPQVWAWHRSRIPKMARTIDLMLCLFPFEKPLYEKSGLRTEFVGHPMLDSLCEKQITVARENDLVALLPGSRKRELKKIFPTMLATAALMHRRQPGLRFATAASSEKMRALLQAILAEYPGVPCEITLRNAYDLMQRAATGLVASGTATLEACYFRLPFALVYKVAWLTYEIGRRVIRVPFIGMANILAGREVVREFIQDAAQPETLADYLLGLLQNPAAREKLIAGTDEAIATLGAGGAAGRAAEVILREVNSPVTKLPQRNHTSL